MGVVLWFDWFARFVGFWYNILFGCVWCFQRLTVVMRVWRFRRLTGVMRCVGWLCYVGFADLLDCAVL